LHRLAGQKYLGRLQKRARIAVAAHDGRRRRHRSGEVVYRSPGGAQRIFHRKHTVARDLAELADDGDATIIDAPSSTKNKAGARDLEMSSTKKGNA
jgi:hypothetical protein